MATKTKRKKRAKPVTKPKRRTTKRTTPIAVAPRVRGSIRQAHASRDHGSVTTSKLTLDDRIKMLHETIDTIAEDVSCEDFETLTHEVVMSAAEMAIVHMPHLGDEMIEKATILFRTPPMIRLMEAVDHLQRSNEHLDEDAVVDFVIARMFGPQPEAATVN